MEFIDLLTKYCKDTQPNKEPLTLNSTFQDVVEFLNGFERFNKRILKLKESPDYLIGLTKTIEDLNNKIIEPTYTHYKLRDYGEHFISLAYNKTVLCTNGFLYEYQYSLINDYNKDNPTDRFGEKERNYNEYKNLDSNLTDIAKGVTYAHKLPELKKELNDLTKGNTNTSVMETTPKTAQIKLQWMGQKNQLYNVLRQLKSEYELIGNSYNNLADFLIQNVTGFENTSKETIEKELKKKTVLPKTKRINLRPNEED